MGVSPIRWDDHLSTLGVLSDTELARQLGTTESSVRRARRARGIPRSPVQAAKKIGRPALDLEPYKSLPLGQISDSQIAREYKLGLSTVARVRKLLGIAPVIEHPSPGYRVCAECEGRLDEHGCATCDTQLCECGTPRPNAPGGRYGRCVSCPEEPQGIGASIVAELRVTGMIHVEALAERLGCHPRHLRRALEPLANDGVVRRHCIDEKFEGDTWQTIQGITHVSLRTVDRPSYVRAPVSVGVNEIHSPPC